MIHHRQVYVYKEKPTRYFALKKMNTRGVDHSYSCAECHYETWNPKMNLLQFHAAMGQSQAENENQPIGSFSVRHVFTMKWMVFILKKHTLLLPCKFWIYYIYIIYCHVWLPAVPSGNFASQGQSQVFMEEYVAHHPLLLEPWSKHVIWFMDVYGQPSHKRNPDSECI